MGTARPLERVATTSFWWFACAVSVAAAVIYAANSLTRPHVAVPVIPEGSSTAASEVVLVDAPLLRLLGRADLLVTLVILAAVLAALARLWAASAPPRPRIWWLGPSSAALMVAAGLVALGLVPAAVRSTSSTILVQHAAHPGSLRPVAMSPEAGWILLGLAYATLAILQRVRTRAPGQ